MARITDEERLKKAVEDRDFELVQELSTKLLGKKNDKKPSKVQENVHGSEVRWKGNKFHDDGTIAVADKKIPGTKKTTPRRPSMLVDVVCSKCGKSERVHPNLAPISIGKNEKTLYRCNRCARGKK